MATQFPFDEIPAWMGTLDYAFVEGEGGVNEGNGVVSYALEDEDGEQGYLSLGYTFLVNVRVTITVLDYVARNPFSYQEPYIPARVLAGSTEVPNEAPPYPAAAIAGDAEVDGFTPSPLTFDYPPNDGSGSAIVLFRPAQRGTSISNYRTLPGNWALQVTIESLDPEPTPDPEPGPSGEYNCSCDDGLATVTLKQMRERIGIGLGFAAQVEMGYWAPGMKALIDNFIRSAHNYLYARYTVMQRRRMFTWQLQPGVRFYDLDGDTDRSEGCSYLLNPDRLEWVGISRAGGEWRPLCCGINPIQYGAGAGGVPTHYEIRQCIEVWPAPTDASYKLRIKGDFGPAPLEGDDDVLTVDAEAVYLHALSQAKMHYAQPDAGVIAGQASSYVAQKVAGSHQTRRYVPGGTARNAAPRPMPVGGFRSGG